MTIQVRGKNTPASAGSNSVTSMSVPPPSSAAPVSGDLLLTFFEDAGTAQPTVTPPSGWTLIPSSVVYDAAAGASGPFQAIYWKRATGSEAAETWGWTASFGAVIGQAAYYSDTGARVDIDQCAAAPAPTPGATTRTTPSLTVTQAARLIEFHNDLNQSVWTGVTGTVLFTGVRSASLSYLIAGSTVTAGTYSRTATSDKSTSIRTDGLLSLTETVLGNTAPTVAIAAADPSLGPNQTVDPNLVSGATFTLAATGTATTSGATIASYTWRRINSTAGFVQSYYQMSSTSTASIAMRTATASDGDVSTWGVTVKDSNGLSSTEATVTVTALPHDRWLMTGAGLVPIRRQL